MGSRGHRRVAVAAVLVALLAAPSITQAVPGSGPSEDSTAAVAAVQSQQETAEQRAALFRTRLNLMLQRRRTVFDQASGQILDGVDRVDAISGEVATAGGDTSAVKTKLDDARRLVEEAKIVEAGAADMFGAVPDAEDRRVAFEEAKDESGVAAQKLSDARVVLRNAILDLRAVVNGLKEVSP